MNNCFGEDKVDKPLVSIWCLVYNHAPYIREALESFLMQETNFKYEIVIHDDASTDGTKEILREYEEKYPDIVRVFYQPVNVYKLKNAKRIWTSVAQEMIRGKYVAFCEGDDYWTDTKKLQKQVDYMEKNEDCCCVTHNALKVDYSTGEESVINTKYKSGDVPVRQIIFQNEVYLPTASIMTRGYIVEEDLAFEDTNGDEILKLTCATRGKIHYIDEIMSVYRYKTEGSWSKTNSRDEKEFVANYLKYIRFLVKFNDFSKMKYERDIYERINGVLPIIHSACENMDEESFKNMMKEIIQEYGSEYTSYTEWISNKKKIHIPETEYTGDLKIFCEKNKKVMLWGAGKYSAKYSELLEENGVQIEGYIVTHKNENEDVFRGKSVWEIKEIAEVNKNTAIVVAIGKGIWKDVLKLLLYYNMTNFYYPLYYDFYDK